jgi:pre-mRNA cleavage complex 2 protein Pcf11
VDEKTRAQMFKLRQTWNEVFPPKKLYAVDVRVNSIDPAWPITAVPPTIYVNPKFFRVSINTVFITFSNSELS